VHFVRACVGVRACVLACVRVRACVRARVHSCVRAGFGCLYTTSTFHAHTKFPRTDEHTARWQAMCGAKGRWKRNLIARCVREGKTHDDISCSPVVRQTPQHWAYRLTEADHSEYKTQIAAGAKTAFIPASSMPPIEPPIYLLQNVGATAGRGSEVRRTKTKFFLVDAIMKRSQEKILKRRGLTARANDRDFGIVEVNSCASDVRLPVVYHYVIQFEYQHDLCLLL